MSTVDAKVKPCCTPELLSNDDGLLHMSSVCPRVRAIVCVYVYSYCTKPWSVPHFFTICYLAQYYGSDLTMSDWSLKRDVLRLLIWKVCQAC